LTLEFENKIKEKETEISVLKEMLKSSQTMLRMKNSELERLRKASINSSFDAALVMPLSKISETPNRRRYISAKSNGYHSISTTRHSPQPIRNPKKNNLLFSLQDRADFIKKLSLERSNEKKSPTTINEDANIEEQGSKSKDESSFYSQQVKSKSIDVSRDEDITLKFMHHYNFSKIAEQNEDLKKPRKPSNIFDPNYDTDLSPGNVVR